MNNFSCYVMGEHESLKMCNLVENSPLNLSETCSRKSDEIHPIIFWLDYRIACIIYHKCRGI